MTPRGTARAAVILSLLLCAASPARAQEPAVPRCVPAPGGGDTTLVRYDCTGVGEWARVRYSLSLPAGWTVQEMEERNVTLVASGGSARVITQGSDQLFVPVTAQDTAEFWTAAANLLLDRVPSEREVQELIRDAGDVDGARFMLTRAQSTDSALASLAGMMGAQREDIEVIGALRGVATLGGRRAGALREVRRANGMVLEMDGRLTVHDGVFYGLAFLAPEGEFAAHRELWERVLASFVIHPAAP